MDTSSLSRSNSRPVNRTSNTDDTVFFEQHQLVSEPTPDMGSSGSANEPTKQKRALQMRDVLTFWIILVLVLALGVGISFGIMGPSYSAGDFEQQLPKEYVDGVYLLGVVQTLDVPAQKLTVQWMAYQCSTSSGCQGLKDATRFYIDKNATLSSKFDQASAVEVFESDLTSSITNEALCYGLTSPECWRKQIESGVPYEQTISTEHTFSIRPARSWRSMAQAYPFDTYEVRSTFLALEGARNVSRRFVGASISGSIPNFYAELQTLRFSSTRQDFEWMMMTIIVQRAEIVVGFAFLIWIINWLMTGIVLWITITAVQGRRRIPEHLFAVPVVALFALPTVRQSMPGGPAFGCILDYCGIILNLGVLVVCSVVLLICAVARDAREFYPPSRSLLVEKFRKWRSRSSTNASDDVKRPTELEPFISDADNQNPASNVV